MSQPSPLAAALAQAQALRAAGDLTTARELLEDALDAARPMLGDDHPELLGGQHVLATLHREADDPAAARRVLEEALAAGELHLGEAHPLMLALSFDLGTVAEELGNRHEARRNFNRVATFGPTAFGEDHHMVRTAASYLASTGGEIPPLPPMQPTVAPPPPGARQPGPPFSTGQPPLPPAGSPFAAPQPFGTQPAVPPGQPSVAGQAGPPPFPSPSQPFGSNQPGTPPGQPPAPGHAGPPPFPPPSQPFGSGQPAGPPGQPPAQPFAAGQAGPAPFPPTTQPFETRQLAGPPGQAPGSGQPGPPHAAPFGNGQPAGSPGQPPSSVPPGPTHAQTFGDGQPSGAGQVGPLPIPSTAEPFGTGHLGTPPWQASGSGQVGVELGRPDGPPGVWPPASPTAGDNVAQPTSADSHGFAARAHHGQEVAPGVFAPARNGAEGGDAAARAAIDAPTQALPTQPQRQTGRTLADAGSPVAPGQNAPMWDGGAPPRSGAPGSAVAPGQPGDAAGWGGTSGQPGASWGGGAADGAWGRELEPARERMPQAFGPRPEPAASPATAVEVAPVSLHGPMAAAAARERARGRSATVAAFVAAAAAVVAALLVVFVVLRRETEPPRVGAVPEVSAGAPIPTGPALGGAPPTDLAVRADGDALLLTWTDPTAGTVPFIVAAGRAGTQLRAMATIEPGATRYLANGLSSRYDYCFTVVAVYSSDQYAASGQVCTTRTTKSPE
ncbi:tetratricopeptide repeat protein [Asanoa iriomotensis]|uniref:tetratricopeptide repeat protein n=1 Tax=Asanoa iriomotensis TaxID=234613 RepID=UPI0023B30853|nr:tetratricopeptide repeat protein [Asanoa iriomotensis]